MFVEDSYNVVLVCFTSWFIFLLYGASVKQLLLLVVDVLSLILRALS